ncbi:MAG: peptide chain release factor-like protein [Planctomycetes bacterium]|nr:peptide chain release factor-like protein [Planctomycetota bacterium]
MHPARKTQKNLELEVKYEATRSTGPGGQHRNRVATAIRVTHLPTSVSAMGTERRSQLENKKTALFRLRYKLALHHRSEIDDGDLCPPAAYQPSAEWMRRLKGQKIKVSPSHDDYPALLAEVLDRLRIDLDEISETALAFRVSNSQLIKFLAGDQHALHELNERRKKKGQKPLRG